MGVSIVEHSIELAKILYKYALVSVDDGDRLLTMLEKKINSLKNIELASESLEIRNSQILIRQNYIEIIILHIYNTLDNHVLTQGEDFKFVPHLQSKFNKLQMILLNYIMQPNSNDLLSQTTKNLCIDFLNIMYNYDDGYSLNLTSAKRPKLKLKNLSYAHEIERLDGCYEEARKGNFDKTLIREFFVSFIESFKKYNGNNGSSN